MRARHYYLTELGGKRLWEPLGVLVRVFGEGDVTAALFEMAAVGRGASEEEALEELRGEVLKLYEELKGFEDLGLLALKWKRALERAIEGPGAGEDV
jgi:hypothetical protein